VSAVDPARLYRLAGRGGARASVDVLRARHAKRREMRERRLTASTSEAPLLIWAYIIAVDRWRPAAPPTFPFPETSATMATQPSSVQMTS